MNWKRYYKQHLVNAEDAVSHVQSGNRMVVTHTCGGPSYLLDVTVTNAKAYKDVEIVHVVTMGKAEYCKPKCAESLRHNAFFVGGTNRDTITGGRGDFTPSFFFKVPRQFNSTMPVDMTMVAVTPPDENDMCSPGTSADYALEAVRQAKLVIAQVNPQMPQTGPYSLVSVGDLDCIAEHETPIIELKLPKVGDIEKTIEEHCASLAPDGAALQLGIDAIPNAVLLFLRHKKDLGVHSEMFSDGVAELAEAGVITNAKKTFHPGKFEVAFFMSTRRLYNFVDHNPGAELRPAGYINNPFVIAQNENMVSINSCVWVDLMGQVTSEGIGPKQISGAGGQVDFVRGASASRGGVSIITMPSTVRGKISKVVPLLDEGVTVTTSRNNVGYIVTEYDVTALKDQTLCQCARNLIKTAHPDFHGEPRTEYEKRFHYKYQAAWDGPEAHPI